jgi:hypothetical protein
MNFIHASTISTRLTALQLRDACVATVVSHNASFQEAANEVNAYFSLVTTQPASIDISVTRVASDLQAFTSLYQQLGYDVVNDGTSITISVPQA